MDKVIVQDRQIIPVHVTIRMIFPWIVQVPVHHGAGCTVSSMEIYKGLPIQTSLVRYVSYSGLYLLQVRLTMSSQRKVVKVFQDSEVQPSRQSRWFNRNQFYSE